MPSYLLSTHVAAGAAREPMTEEQMQQAWQAIGALEADMRAAGALVFSGRLDGPEAVSVVRPSSDGSSITDGPFVETKEHLGGFYIIEATDLEAARAWAAKVARTISAPIEVWPFVATALG